MDSDATVHTWNLIEFEDYYKYIDLTALDTYHEINETVKKD